MGIKKTLETDIRKRVEQFRRKKLWDRAFAIAQKLGKREERVASDHTTISYDFSYFPKSGSFLKIRVSNFVYGGFYIVVDSPEGRVLDAQECHPDDESAKKSPLQVIQCSKSWFLVNAYVPGDWEKMLNLKLLQKKINAQKAAEKAKAQRQREEAENSRVLNEEEKRLKSSFGLNK